MKKLKCDRCGAEIDSFNQLMLLQPKFESGSYQSRSHVFDLCDACTRKVFHFIGQGQQKETLAETILEPIKRKDFF